MSDFARADVTGERTRDVRGRKPGRIESNGGVQRVQSRLELNILHLESGTRFQSVPMHAHAW